MRPVLIIFFFLIGLSGAAQTEPAELAKQLTADQTTELGKVKAIFNWITENISYKTRSSPGNKVIGAASYKNYYEEQDDDNRPLRPVNDRVSLTVLRKKEAVCDGFARLFTTLCDYAGIRSEIIAGYARVGSISKKGFRVNHNWNAVRIDGKWHLLDVTWATGYLTLAGDEFVRRFDPSYFLTPPTIFIKDHYPDDARWTLLENTTVPDEFRRSPFRQKSFVKYGIHSFYPSNGIIETFLGDTIRLNLELVASDLYRNICPDLLVDSAIYSHSSSWVFLHPEQAGQPNKFLYTLNVTSPDIEWLYLMYNDDMVLRYKVNVKDRRKN